MRATRVGADTALAQIARLVTEAQTGKAPVQRLADRVSAVFVPVVIVLAVATLGFWLGGGASATFAFTAAVAVLIIACPCALGLATPTALLVGTGRGAQLGILIKGPEVLESTRRVDTIVLDKTGTVTTGRDEPASTSSSPATATAPRLLRLVGALEHASEHPIARAIADAPRRRARRAARRSSRSATARASASRASSTATRVVAGRPALLAEWGHAACRPSSRPRAARRRRGARRSIAAGWDGAGARSVVVADTVKPTSAEAVARAQGARPAAGAADRRQRARPPAPSPPRSGSTR